MAELLLNAEADPNMRSQREGGPTPFYDAIVGMQNAQDTELVDVLLQSGRCLINQRMGAGRPSAFSLILHMANTWPQELVTSLAVRMIGAVKDIDGDRCEKGYTLLHVATSSGMVDIVNVCSTRAPISKQPTILNAHPSLWLAIRHRRWSHSFCLKALISTPRGF
jgi:hypothetical protein